MRIVPNLLSRLSLLVLFPCALTAQAGNVVLSDGQFDDADWSVRFDGTNVSRLDPSGGVQFPLGGNPGAFREITNAGFNFQAGGGASIQSIFSWHLNTAQPYDPSVSGAIESLDFTEDGILLAAPAQTGYLALKQDDLLFRSKQSFVLDSPGWQSSSLSNLQAADFEVLFNGSFLPTGNPDFSSTGAPIEFGVVRLTLVGGRQLPRARSGLDNWRVDIKTSRIPEPSTVLLLVLSGATVFAGRRTSSQRDATATRN